MSADCAGVCDVLPAAVLHIECHRWFLATGKGRCPWTAACLGPMTTDSHCMEPGAALENWQLLANITCGHDGSEVFQGLDVPKTDWHCCTCDD